MCLSLMCFPRGMRSPKSFPAGAQASPLQCVPLADSCLALGAQVLERKEGLDIFPILPLYGCILVDEGPHASSLYVVLSDVVVSNS